MYFKQFVHPETGCLSYAPGCLTTRELIIVDPQPDAGPYLALADQLGAKILRVIDTHIHADHLSGGRELAERAGAPYSLHESADVSFAFESLTDGQVVQAGNAHMRVVHTPGHSPESICLVVSDHARGEEPAFVFTGDTLLIGDVGRPDLHVDAKEGATDLHASLGERLLQLPDHLEVFPAHFSGSVCGQGLSPRTSSTLGYERRVNRLLGLDREEFVNEVTAKEIPRPERMAQIVAANKGS